MVFYTFLSPYNKGCASWKIKFWKGLKTLKNDIFWCKDVIFQRFEPVSKFFSLHNPTYKCLNNGNNYLEIRTQASIIRLNVLLSMTIS